MTADLRDLILAAARRYWDIRNSGDLSERRSQAHNDMIDAMDAAGLKYYDRDHAAMIAKELLDAPLMTEQYFLKLALVESYERWLGGIFANALTPRETKNLEGA